MADTRTDTQQRRHDLAMAADWLRSVAAGVAAGVAPDTGASATWGDNLKVRDLAKLAADALTER